MLHVFITLLSIFIYNSQCVEEDNLKNALNSIANRQKQLTSANYYVVPNKDSDKELPYDDDLMYLNSPPRDYDTPSRETIGYGYQKSPIKNYRMYDDDRIQYSETDDYQKELKERLLERLMLDILENEDVDSPPPASTPRERTRPPQKKSFFREREFSEIPENLQNIYPNLDEEMAPSPFRERAKTRTRSSHRRLTRPTYELEDNQNEESDDYSNNNVINSLFDKYKEGSSPSLARGGDDYGVEDLEADDSDPLTNEDVEDFISYLNDKAAQTSYYDYVNEGTKRRDEAKRSNLHGKRYLLGGDRNERYSIQKRSAVQEKPSTTTASAAASTTTTVGSGNSSSSSSSSTEKITSNNVTTTTAVSAVTTTTESQANKTKSPKKVEVTEKPKSKQKKSQAIVIGQKEIPIDIKSQIPLNIKKKSVDWSEYFGVDKRQKKSNAKDQQRKDDVLLDQYIQSYILQSVRNSAFGNPRGSAGGSTANYRYFPKREKSYLYDPYYQSNYDKLETDDDLRKAEDLIIDNVLKYTGAHEGVTDRKELERFKENIINELAAAYNLEKLRKEIFDDDSKKKKKSDERSSYYPHLNNKRVAVKKESAENVPSEPAEDLKIKHNATFFNKEHAKKPNQQQHQQQQHEHIKRRYSKGSDGNECPVISKLITKCQQASHSVKDFEGTFIPSCILHQICYICGTKDRNTDMCDINFLSDMSSVCGNEPLCRYSAQRVLRALSDVKNSVYKCDSCIADVLQYFYEK